MSEPISPINCLPLELVSLILAVTYNRYASSVDYGFSPLTKYPVLLSSVCSYWRYAATNTPVLWSNIDIKSIEQAREYFRRSQTGLLRVRLAGVAYDAESPAPSNKAVLPRDMIDLLAAHSSRFQSLVLSLSEFDNAASAFSALLPQLAEHTLQDLALYTDRSHERLGPFMDEHLDKLLKPLRRFHLESFNIHLNNITCHNLTELFLAYPQGGLSTADIAHLLKSNPNLSSLTLFGLISVTMSPGNMEPIRLPALRRLQIDGYAERMIPWLFAVLEPGPLGIDLHLDCISPLEHRESVLMDSLIRFFQKASITTLHLETTELSIPMMLRFLPHLWHLKLTSYYFDHPILGGIPGVVGSLGKIQAIDLHKCELEDYHRLDGGLEALLKIPSLQQVRYFGCGRTPEDGIKLRGLLDNNNNITAKITESPELELETRPYLFR